MPSPGTARDIPSMDSGSRCGKDHYRIWPGRRWPQFAPLRCRRYSGAAGCAPDVSASGAPIRSQQGAPGVYGRRARVAAFAPH